MPRKVPRPFKMHWGRGKVVEEVSFRAKYHEPALQLMEFEDGSLCLRFCYYKKGRFQRSPLMLGSADLPKLAKALHGSPRLKRLLKKALAL